MGIVERKEAVHRVLTAYAASDEEALRALLTDDVVWWVPPSAASRYPRPLAGIEAVLAVLAGPSLAYHKPTIEWAVHHVIADEDSIVMANASMTAMLLNGSGYSNEYCYVFRFEGDRIAEAREYTDTAYALERAAAPGKPSRPNPA
jgi:ketosteroid isomerase-like protein